MWLLISQSNIWGAVQLAPGLNIEMAIDVVYGAAVFRLMRDADNVAVADIEETVRWSVRGLLAEQP